MRPTCDHEDLRAPDPAQVSGHLEDSAELEQDGLEPIEAELFVLGQWGTEATPAKSGIKAILSTTKKIKKDPDAAPDLLFSSVIFKMPTKSKFFLHLRFFAITYLRYLYYISLQITSY